MGKDGQEVVCFKNLKSSIGGKYVNKMLRDFRHAYVVEEWEESPDFLVEHGEKGIGVEHFVIDHSYSNSRAVSRIFDHNIWNVYNVHHSALENGVLDEDLAINDLQKEMQLAFDLIAEFDYEICMDQFKRVFDNHIRKIPSYLSNMQYKNKYLYFLIEYRSLLLGGVKCIAIRSDGAAVEVNANSIVFTERMVDIIEKHIGKLWGIIIQNYSFFDVGNTIQSMVYLDMTSRESLAKSLKEQQIKVYKRFYLEVPRRNLRLILEK